MKFLRVMNDLINLSQVARFELHTGKVRVYYAMPELISDDNDRVVGSKQYFEEYTGPAAEQLRRWLTDRRPVADVEIAEL